MYEEQIQIKYLNGEDTEQIGMCGVQIGLNSFNFID